MPRASVRDHETGDKLARRHGYVLLGQARVALPAAPGLHVVATPIGNLSDLSIRALETLAGVDVVACEDTRVTAKLCERFGLSTPRVPYHDHNAAEARPLLLARLARGESVALVSDAGTPLVSDPGFKLVEAALEAGHRVVPIPGPSAVMAALVAAGLPTDRFFFDGFLPPKSVGRRRRLAELARVPAAIVLFESGPRLADTLADMAEAMPGRVAAVCRELTKLHEEVARGPIDTLAARYLGTEPKGEIVVVVGPPPEEAPAEATDVDAALRDALARMPLKDAATAVAGALGLPRRDVYARALALKGQP